jgi:cytidylate kinase
MEDRTIITIDGSAWTGKSTVSQALAKLLGFQYINTGSMFRALAFLIQKQGIQTNEKARIVELMRDVNMEFRKIENQSHLFVNGKDFTENVKNNQLVPIASEIGVIAEIRDQLVIIQREACKEGGFVIEGRDIGTTVFPKADWKFFLNASTEIKIKRFFKMLSEKQKELYTFEQVREIVESTDKRDREREVAPLRRASDAIIYDNSTSPSAEQDAAIIWYYITQSNDLLENSRILESKKKN